VRRTAAVLRRHATSLALGLVLATLGACATTAGGDGGKAAAAANVRLSTNDRFCPDAQAQVSMTSVPVVNVVYTDFDEFVKSKPRPRPLETDQYVWYEDAARTRPKMVSCKMKTTDHIIAEYGPGASGGNVSCAALNQRTVELVLGSLTRAERKRLKFDAGQRIAYDEDLLTGDGPVWLAPFPVLYVAADGTLRVKSKSMKNDWNDPRLAKADVRVRGTRYCHLVAPEYLKRVLLGDVAAEAAP
jgi:hypothetical protein